MKMQLSCFYIEFPSLQCQTVPRKDLSSLKSDTSVILTRCSIVEIIMVVVTISKRDKTVTVIRLSDNLSGFYTNCVQNFSRLKLNLPRQIWTLYETLISFKIRAVFKIYQDGSSCNATLIEASVRNAGSPRRCLLIFSSLAVASFRIQRVKIPTQTLPSRTYSLLLGRDRLL